MNSNKKKILRVKDLIEKLKNMPEDARVNLIYLHLDDERRVYCFDYLTDVVFDEYNNNVDLMTKGY